MSRRVGKEEQDVCLTSPHKTRHHQSACQVHTRLLFTFFPSSERRRERERGKRMKERERERERERESDNYVMSVSVVVR